MTSPRRGSRPRQARAIWARRAARPAIRSACSCATSATPNCSPASRRSRWLSGWRRGRRRRWRRCASARRPSPRSPHGATRCRTGASGCAIWSSWSRHPAGPAPLRCPRRSADPALEEGLRPETLARLDAVLAANGALRAARREPAEAYQVAVARDGRGGAAPGAAPQPDRSADRRTEGGVRPAGGARPGGARAGLGGRIAAAGLPEAWDGSAASVARVERRPRRRSARRCAPGWRGIRSDIEQLEVETGLPIAELRRVLHDISRGEREAQATPGTP